MDLLKQKKSLEAFSNPYEHPQTCNTLFNLYNEFDFIIFEEFWIIFAVYVHVENGLKEDSIRV